MSVIYTPPARWNEAQEARRAKPDTNTNVRLDVQVREARFVNDGIVCRGPYG